MGARLERDVVGVDELTGAPEGLVAAGVRGAGVQLGQQKACL